MSDDWPHGWYSDEPDRPGAGGQRPQPSFTPNSPGSRGQRRRTRGRGWYAPGNAGGGGNRGRPNGRAGPGPGDRAAWPAQPPSRSWTGGGGGARCRRWRVPAARRAPVAAPAAHPGHPGGAGRADRGGRRGGLLQRELQADQGRRAHSGVVHLGRDELADHGVRQPGRAEQEGREPARPRARHLRQPFGHDPAPARAGQRDPSDAGQPAAGLLRADPGARLQQAQRGVRIRRPEAAGADRAERHRAARQPLHGHRLRRAGQRGQRRRRRARVPARRR